MQLAAINGTGTRLVSGRRLLEIVFEEEGRPSIRWLAYHRARGTIPYVKVGRRVFFDPSIVRETLAKNFTVATRLDARVGRPQRV